MKVSAKLKYLRIAPRKVRLIADMIRGKRVDNAQAILRFTVKGASGPMLKLLNSAVANAKNNFQLESDNLYISKIEVSEGPKLKRWRARARGQAGAIQKKSSHIFMTLDEMKGKAGAKKAAPKKVAAKKAAPEAAESKPEAEKKVRTEKPRFRPDTSSSRVNRSTRGINKIFRRKAV